MAPRQGRQGHGQLATYTYVLALNKTQVSALRPHGPLVNSLYPNGFSFWFDTKSLG